MNKFLFFLACATLILPFVYIARADDENDYGMFRFSIEEILFLLLLAAKDAQQFLQKRLFKYK
jgi:hypothetical protein